MYKTCVCGKTIKSRRSLCAECLEIYGANIGEWPEWLRWLVADIQREWDTDRNHDELEYRDEIDYDLYDAEGIDGEVETVETEWGNYQDVDALIKAERAFEEGLAKPTSPNRQEKIDHYWLNWHNKYHKDQPSQGCEYCKKTP